MLILPELLPDETIYSLLARIARINGINHLALVGFLLGEKYPLSVMGCPVNIKHFCIATQYVYGSPREILLHLTLLPILAHLGELRASTLSEIENGNRKPGLATLSFGISKGCQWRVCKVCVARDVEVYGIAYWHRIHQLPTSQYCPEHGLFLERLNFRRIQLHEHLVMPYELTTEIEEAREIYPMPEHSNIYMGISLMGRDALCDFSEHVSPRAIQTTFMDGLDRLGVMTARGNVCLPDYFKKYMQKFGVGNSIDTLMRQAKTSNPKQLLFGITDERPSRPFARLMLAYWLFDTWWHFKEQCRWQDMLVNCIEGEAFGFIQSMKNKQNQLAQVMLQQKRQICLDYKASHAIPTRLEFFRKSYRAFRWLRHNDQAWLDAELPLLKKGKKTGNVV